MDDDRDTQTHAASDGDLVNRVYCRHETLHTHLLGDRVTSAIATTTPGLFNQDETPTPCHISYRILTRLHPANCEAERHAAHRLPGKYCQKSQCEKLAPGIDIPLYTGGLDGDAMLLCFHSEPPNI